MIKKIDDKSVKQPLRVLILSAGPYDISPPWNEGTKNNQIAWINYLKGQNIEFYVISTKTYKLENTKIYPIPININTVFKKVWFTVRMSLLARKLCKNNEIDTINFAFNDYGILIPIIMLRGINKRKILTLASERYLKKLEIFGISFFDIPYCVKKFIFRSFDGIICISKKLKEELKKTKLIPKDEILFFPAMPINISEWKQLAKKRELRNKYGIKENEIVLLHVGHFKKNRGVDVLLKSMVSLKNENIKLFLIWNGRGNKNGIINTINKLNIDEKVKIMRNVNDIREIYSISDLFIFPQITQINIIEYPLSIIEAMLMANVVIATDHPSFRELVKENTGVLIPPNDVDALTTELLKLIKNHILREDLSAAARESILQLYSKQSPEYLTIFYKGNKEPS